MHHYIEIFLWNTYEWPEYNKLYNGSALGGVYAYREGSSKDYYSFSNDLEGFLNGYSTLAPEEDRAEIIAFYMNPLGNEHKNLIEKCKTDKVLREKTEFVLGLYEELGFENILDDFHTEIKK